MNAPSGVLVKRIAPQAYEAPAEALAAVNWNKAPFERHLRLALRENPELLARIDFNQTKRAVAGLAVQLLAHEARYQQTTLQIMTDLADMRTFPNLATQPDAQTLLARAEAAVSQLRVLTSTYRHDVDEQARIAAQRQASEATQAARNAERIALASIGTDFSTLQAATDPQRRGRQFEGILYRLLEVFDMQPRLAYVISREQIDGSFTFNTDDFLLEAKWCKERIERDQADVFAAKIVRKGRNTLGLYVSINGFTEGFLNIPHPTGCPFITMDGEDLFLVLDGRADLQEAIHRKRRHLNDTGSCHLPVRTLLL